MERKKKKRKIKRTK